MRKPFPQRAISLMGETAMHTNTVNVDGEKHKGREAAHLPRLIGGH